MILRLLLAALLSAVTLFAAPASAQEAAKDSCFPSVGCLDTTYVGVAALQSVECNALAAMRDFLTAKRPGKPRTLKERANLRLITRVERQKKCVSATAVKKSKPAVVAAQPPAAPSPAIEAPAASAEPGGRVPGSPVALDGETGSGSNNGSSGSAIASAEPPDAGTVEQAEAQPGAAAPPTRSLPAAAAEPKSAGAEDPAYVTKTVYYGTDRKPTGSKEANQKYAGDRGELVLGTATVSIPKDHRIGALEAPSLLRLEFSEDPAKHVVLLTAEEKPAGQYYADVAAAVAAAPDKSAFIFVHGYNVTFKDAARRTAQMAYDLKFQGAPAFFSWPSQGTTLGYKYDEGNVEWAAPDLKQFIADFADKSKAENLYLVGHSMGTRALVGAVKELFQERPALKKRFREIILAAPDIDADIFRRSIAPAFKDTNLVTLYASSKDLALTLSKQFNGYARAGDSASGIVVMPGIDTIEASDVATDFVGHAYFGASTSIITDIYEIVQGKTLPKQRPHLLSVTDPVGAYWKFQRGATP